MNDLTQSVLGDPWVIFVLLTIALTVAVIFTWDAISKRLGNAGKPGKCLACGADATMAVPQIGLSFADRLFSPNGKPCEPRLIHDFTDPRRMCRRHHDERALELQRDLSQHNADTRKASQESYKRLRDRSDTSLTAMLPKPDAEPPKTQQASVPDARVQGWPST